MRLIVCTRGQAMGAHHDKPWAVISIRGSDEEKPLEFFCNNLKGVLHLAFDDITKLEPGLVAFNLTMAEQVWDFVTEHKDVDAILVHCYHGMSRSPGIAAAIDKVMNGDDSVWFKTKTPNDRVYRGLMNIAHYRKLI